MAEREGLSAPQFRSADFAQKNGLTLRRATFSLEAVDCPVFLLAGEADDITTKEQVFNAEKYLGTSEGNIEKKLMPGGHIGLFMGSRNLSETWPQIARWICDRTASPSA